MVIKLLVANCKFKNNRTVEGLLLLAGEGQLNTKVIQNYFWMTFFYYWTFDIDAFSDRINKIYRILIL